MHRLLRWNQMNYKGYLIALMGLFCISNSVFAQTDSKLSTGKWIKIGITQNGIYKIDASWLDKNKIDRASLNPKQVSLYSTNAGTLPQDLKISRPQDLEEIPIYFEGEQDNKWDASDFFIFWGNSPHKIIFDFQKKSLTRHLVLYNPLNNKNWDLGGTHNPHHWNGYVRHWQKILPLNFLAFFHVGLLSYSYGILKANNLAAS